MKCPTGNISFGARSKKGLENIKRLKVGGEWMVTLFASGIFSNLFSGKPLKASYSLATSDWELYIQASSNFSKIVTHQIRLQAGVLANDPTLSRNERDFWVAILSGCR